MPRRSASLSIRPWRSFADGFAGSLIGGLIYWLALAWFNPHELRFAWVRVLALSLIFGGFELWRVTRRRTLGTAKACLVFTLTVSVFVLWALGALIPSVDSAHSPTIPGHLTAYDQHGK